jgi:hypothetical protein
VGLLGLLMNEQLGARRDRRGQLCRRDLVALLGTRVDADGHAVREQRHVGIGHPVGRRDHAFIARIEQRGADVEAGLLGAGGHQDLAAFVGQAIVALELGNDGVFEFGGAVDRGIARDPLANRLDARICNMDRRIEIRFAGPRPMMSLPSALSLAARAVTARVGEGLTF